MKTLLDQVEVFPAFHGQSAQIRIQISEQDNHHATLFVASDPLHTTEDHNAWMFDMFAYDRFTVDGLPIHSNVQCTTPRGWGSNLTDPRIVWFFIDCSSIHPSETSEGIGSYDDLAMRWLNSTAREVLELVATDLSDTL